MRLAVLIFSIWSTLFEYSRAAEFFSDAFGIYSTEDASRKKWSSIVEYCHMDQCEQLAIDHEKASSLRMYFGQKSLKVMRDNGMLLIIAEDRFGNLVRQGKVNFTVENNQVSFTSPIQYGAAYKLFKASAKQGTFLAAGYTNVLQAQSEIYRQIPDASSFGIKALAPNILLQQGSTMGLESGSLKDRYGNQGAIGFSLTGILKNRSNHYSFLPMVSQNDQASILINTTTMSGEYEFTISSNQNRSNKANLYVKEVRFEDTQSVNASFSKSTNMIEFEIGSLRTNMNYLVQDAVGVELKIVEAGGAVQKINTWTFNGGVEAMAALHDDAFPILILLTSEIGRLSFEIKENEVEILP